MPCRGDPQVAPALTYGNIIGDVKSSKFLGRTQTRSRAVETESRPPLFDRELDIPVRPQPRLSIDDLYGHQRLIVNPCLSVLGWILAIALLRNGIAGKHLGVCLFAILWIFVPALLIQYHCLDCGATGSYFRAKRHCCPGVVERYFTALGKRSFVPSVKAQLLIWLYVISFAIFHYLIFS